ncbi:hypothetical protein [Alloalcanivorax venustensis]|jgi:hypothetical protein|uniref:hypothetical protein n=1 Tax=Alloalcanivorax venustensis TaxID=172371 RepID=UPI002EA5B935|nr:hypothetical protein [Pseudomonadota bacterium]|tara:strand:+ start:16798 stop:17256 length:459 start_codon:yes stop_codon:yes gene_type:complete
MSKPSLPKELQGLLRQNSTLAPLAKAARGRKAAAPKGPAAPPQDCLPPALRDRVTLVEEENRWLAMVETSATAQLLRFHLPRLERSLAPGKSIKILVTGRRAAPAATADKLRANERPPLDAGSAAHIRQAADCVEDEELARALRRLAGRAES